MERLKSMIPNRLNRMICESTPENLAFTCNSLLEFFQPLPQFQLILEELTDPAKALCRKNREEALDLKLKGNVCFSKGDYAEALSFYSQALRQAPMNCDKNDMGLVATLYVNRASSMHRLSLLEECIRDCNRALVLSPDYVKAWYRRGKANASLGNYQVANLDLKVSWIMEVSSSGKKLIEQDLEVLASQLYTKNGTNNSFVNNKHMQLAALDESPHMVIECVTTPSKGRGMASPNDIPPSSLVHREEPLAAIVAKSCRETHCHFCFNEVSADVVFCPSCTVPIYCSMHCQELAGGEQFLTCQNNFTIHKGLSAEFEKHVMDTISSSHSECGVTVNDLNCEHIPEHKHECSGAHWPVVLPADVVLAGRIWMKSIDKRKLSEELSKPLEILELSHNYSKMPSDCKLELHLYAIVLSHCLQLFCNSAFQTTGVSVGQLVMLISQIKINSMAVVHMKSSDRSEVFKNSLKISAVEDTSTCTMEQVRVGQAIYSTGSLFNHSCRPNIHAYFLSRSVFLRSTEFVPAWYPLELSYGPQVGQLGLQERQEMLKDQYSFNCQCTSCSSLILSDLVINAFRCTQPDCLGAVLDTTCFEKLQDDLLHVSSASCSYKLSLPVLRKEEDISKVASVLFQKPCAFRYLNPGYCLDCGANVTLQSGEDPVSVMMDIERLNNSNVAPNILISDALKMLNVLRSVRHPYSKVVAQAEDAMAKAFVRIGGFELSMQHCITSIEILEKLYHPKHIVVGHELTKLASIQISQCDQTSALHNLKRVEEIFSLYYGSHVSEIFPYLEVLRGEIALLAS